MQTSSTRIEEQAAPQRGFRILLIEDAGDDDRELLRSCFLSEGYSFLAAANGQEGLALASEAQPDLILLDSILPDLDGHEVCRRLKQAPATRRIPVVFLSAHSDVADRVRGLGLGAVDYLAKPFDVREMLARVQAALRTKQALDSLERANSELQAFSLTDPLTGLFNRHYFEEQLTAELENLDRGGVRAACLLIDIDHLKDINDTYGHLAGDAALRRLAKIIRRRTRTSDLAARFGGDEFAVLMVGTSSLGARVAAENLRSCVEQATLALHGTVVSMTASVGLACFPLGQQKRIRVILEQADRALYRAKATRNRVEVVELV
jgi:two-component system cell cycle response regulator